LEPGEINQGNITETVMGSLDQDEPQQNTQQKPEDNKEPKEPKEKGEPGDEEQEGEPGEDGENGEPGDEEQEDEPGEDGENGEPGKEKEGRGKEKSKEKSKDGQPSEEDGEPGEEWGDGKEEDKSNWKPDIKKSPKPPVSKADVAKKVEEITQRAANKGTGGGGTSPALRKFLEDMVNPQVDWKKILQKYVSEANEEATLYKIPNRRFVSSDLYLPGLIGKEEGFGTVVIAVDTSGSIGSDEYNTFLAETRKILKMFGPKEVYIIYCSDGMKPPSGDIDHLLSASQPLDPSKQKSTGGNGGGFDPPFKWTDENIVRKGKDLACFLYFTDGGAENPERPKWHKKVIWAMTTSHKMPFGKHVNVPVKKLRNY
jgi:predicted metal-dependent peptidase